MKMPRFLLGAAVLFWGWQTGLWFLALPIALVLEARHVVPGRWDVSEEDFRRIFSVAVVLVVSFTVYLLRGDRSLYFVYTLLQWLPAMVFPLLAAQAYSPQDEVNVRAFFTANNKKADALPQKPWMVSLNYPYFALCILAASAANTENFAFYGGMVGLVTLALWFSRPRRRSIGVWACLMAIAIATGFVGQFGLHQAHQALEQEVVAWLSKFTGQGVDPLRKTTSIGDIGPLKRSSQIVFRVASPDSRQFPLLLREVAYNRYRAFTWLAQGAKFSRLQPAGSGTTWALAPASKQAATLVVSTSLERNKGFLKLPAGAFRLDRLPVSKLERNQYGAIRVEAKGNELAYQVQFGPEVSPDSPPTQEDLEIPKQEQAAIAQVVQQLGLTGQSPQEILQRVENFFFKEFTYSLTLLANDQPMTPLGTFLLNQRSGHCEYFATATTLLLRAVGIPTRYVTGYSVHEFSSWENQYIVRSRHAHAWTMVYLNGRWQTFDTTPPGWTGLEDTAASSWQGLADFWSFLSFKLGTTWDYLTGPGANYWWWLLLPMGVILARQFWGAKGVRRLASPAIAPVEAAPAPPPGTDSEFYLIEQALTELGLVRHPYESLKGWLKRLRQDLSPAQFADLQPILDLHYRYRFDPEIFDSESRARLKQLCQTWLERYRQADQSRVSG